MALKRWRRIATQWLLLLAIGLQGLGPAFAALMPHADSGRIQVVVCTSAGMVIMDLPADGQDFDNLRIHETGDCVACGAPPALPPTPGLMAIAPVNLAVYQVNRTYLNPPCVRLTDSWAWPPGQSPPSLPLFL